MFGFFFGALCLAGMVFVLRRPYAFGYGGGWHGHRGYGRYGWRGGEPWGESGRGSTMPGRARMRLRWVYQRLGTSPAQETVFADAAESVANAAQGFRGEWEQSRGELGRAMRGESFESEVLRSAFARHDERLHALRELLVTEAMRVHEVLDGRQRAALADLLERAPGRGRWNA
jgi:hypothetical protein